MLLLGLLSMPTSWLSSVVRVQFPQHLFRTQLNPRVIVGMAAAYALGASYPEELMDE